MRFEKYSALNELIVEVPAKCNSMVVGASKDSSCRLDCDSPPCRLLSLAFLPSIALWFTSTWK
jgi:hypothetical protein